MIRQWVGPRGFTSAFITKGKMEENSKNQGYTERIKGQIIELGADLVGVANVEPFKQLNLSPSNLLELFHRALSIVIKLPSAVFEQIVTRPTPIYSSAYQAANRLLDEVAFHTVSILEKDGFGSLTISASQVFDRANWHAAISHKAVVRMAGLGWQGKDFSW